MAFVIHIGTHKTGTTAIQHFAMQHRAALRARGLWYPLEQDFGPSRHYAHHRLAHALATDDELTLQGARDLAQAFINGRRNGESVLISAEPIYRRVYPEDTEDYWTGRAAYVDRLRGMFPVDDAEILLVLRRQDSAARSLYQEQVKAGRYTKTFAEFIASSPPFFNYLKQLDLFLEKFPRARVLVYEDLTNPDLIDNFFAAIDIDVSDLPRAKVRNVGWSAPLVEFKRSLNMTALTTPQVHECRRALERGAHTIVSDADWFADREAAEFLARFEEENRRIVERFFPDRERPLFPPIQPSNRPAFTGLTTEQVGEIAAMLVRNEPQRKPKRARPGDPTKGASRSVFPNGPVSRLLLRLSRRLARF